LKPDEHTTPNGLDSGRVRRVATSTIREIVERALVDTDFLARLAEDPIGAMYADGYAVSVDEMKQLLGLGNATDRQVVETVHALLVERGLCARAT
jgi:hypothetical protein